MGVPETDTTRGCLLLVGVSNAPAAGEESSAAFDLASRLKLKRLAARCIVERSSARFEWRRSSPGRDALVTNSDAAREGGRA